MKRLILPLISLLILIGCSKDEASTQSESNSNHAEQSQTIAKPRTVDVAKEMAEFQQILVAHQSRLAQTTPSKNGCKNNVQVPKDYSTIQAAVDNACEGAVIIVKSGSYTELVVVDKPGIKLKANGEVTLIGGFVLNSGANDVTIQQFNIVVGAGNVHAINAREVNGGRILQNTISDPALKGGTAIRFFNGSDVRVHGNHISGTGWGIVFASLLDGGSHDNTISNNHITGMTFASVIGLQGNCDNNLINENTLVDNQTPFNAGIQLYSGEIVNGHCDNNIIKNNVSSVGRYGVWIFGGTHNQIGPDNTFNDNQFIGIYISGAVTDNTVFDNTALDNGDCDIVNQAIDPLSNTFTNNIADCTQGL